MPAPDQLNGQAPLFSRTPMDLESDKRDEELRVADQRGLWAFADLHIPPDVHESAVRWGLENTLPEIWRAAFIAGWRAAHRPIAPTDGGGRGT